MSETKTQTETNGNGNELQAMDGKPVIHPMARPAAKHRNMAVALMKECPEERSIVNLLGLALVEAAISLAETAGTFHYDWKEKNGLLNGKGTKKAKTPTAKEVKEQIDFS